MKLTEFVQSIRFTNPTTPEKNEGLTALHYLARIGRASNDHYEFFSNKDLEDVVLGLINAGVNINQRIVALERIVALGSQNSNNSDSDEDSDSDKENQHWDHDLRPGFTALHICFSQ